MKLTNEALALYVGGDFEVQNPHEGILMRGPVSEAKIEGTGDDATLKVKFNWLAERRGPAPTYGNEGWKKSAEEPVYEASLAISTVDLVGDNRLCVQSSVTGDIGVFFWPGGSKLEPQRVEGLEI